MKICRGKIISNELYEKVKIDIMKLKKVELSSSFYTCVQSGAEKKQKWPLVNFLRQILKKFEYKLN